MLVQESDIQMLVQLGIIDSVIFFIVIAHFGLWATVKTLIFDNKAYTFSH